MKTPIILLLTVIINSVYSQTLILTGKVTDERSGNPLMADISIYSGNQIKVYLNAKTDSLGKYSIELKQGKYKIEFHVPYHYSYVIWTDSTMTTQENYLVLPVDEEYFKFSFKFNSYDIKDLDSSFSRIGRNMFFFPRAKLHTYVKADSSEQDPKSLVRKRAMVVRKQLIANGIPSRRLRIYRVIENGKDEYEIRANRTLFFCHS
ncbi:MAG: hypothetical protein ACJ75J_07205 [Cytophagaceae bacterium]|jgi:hypothetical protein